MSVHRRCCCVQTGCAHGWGSCDDPVLVSLLAGNATRVSYQCDSGSIGCTWTDLAFTEELTSSLTDVEFEYVPASGGIPGHYALKPVASNGGIVAFDFSVTGDAFPFNQTASSCDGSFTPSGLASFSRSLNHFLTGREEAEQFVGTITSDLWWNGSSYECRFILNMSIRVVAYDLFEHNALRLKTGNLQEEIPTIEDTVRHWVQLQATAPHSYSGCPHDAVWTVETLTVSFLGPDFEVLVFTGDPEPQPITDFPIGSHDCGSPGIGNDFEASPYCVIDGGVTPPGGSSRVEFSGDTPTITVLS